MDDELRFLRSVFGLLAEERVIDGTAAAARSAPVVRFQHPEQLERCINFGVDGQPTEDLLETCRRIIRYSVKTSHPHFFNQLYGGVDLYGLGGTWISESLNTNQHTFEIAPAFALAESAILQHVQALFGIDGDGIFSPGGSLSNMYALVLARFKRYPDIKTRGFHSLPLLICFTSEDAHYSLQKGAHWLGFGTDNMIKIKTDDQGRMIPEDFEKRVLETLKNGFVPLFLNATVGTTVFGAIDPLDKLADICLKYGIWFHVDACYGGTLILSKQYAARLNGIQRSDSLAWNPHKMLGAPLQCSIFLTKYKNLLLEANSASATYLFQQDKFYDVSYDTGDKSIQCGRKVDAFKLWVMWKARGDEGFEKIVNNTMDCAKYFQEKITNRAGFRLILENFDTTCVCFYYIPMRLRNLIEDDEWKQRLYKVAPMLKQKMILEGDLMIGYTPLDSKGLGNFWRIVFTCQPPIDFKDVDFAIEKLEQYGELLDC